MGKRRSGVSEPLAFQPSLRPGTKIMGIKPSGRLSYTTVWACGIIVPEATTAHPAVPVQHPPRSRSQKEAVANTFVFSHTSPYAGLPTSYDASTPVRGAAVRPRPGRGGAPGTRLRRGATETPRTLTDA